MNRVDQVMAQFQGLRADYEAARTSRLRKRRNVPLGGAGFDYHIRSEADYLKLIEYARDMDRNDCIVGQAVNRLIDLVMMDGIKLDPQTGDKGLDNELYRRWEDWGENPDRCHVTGEHNLATLVRLAFRHVIVDGDIVMVPIADGTVEPIEAHRIRTPRNTKRNVVNGVLLDEKRRRLEYWVTKDDIDPIRSLSLVSDIRPYPVRDEAGNRQVFHLYLPQRVSQTRGVSTFARVTDVVGMHDDIQFAKLVQQQIVSCFAVLSERPEGYQGGDATGFGAVREQPLGTGQALKIEGVGPGFLYQGRPGELLKGFSPAVPNPEFFEHAMMVLSIIAVNLNLPVLVLLLDPRASNFSGWRGAMDQARVTFLELQRWIAAQLLCHLYRWKLRDWIFDDPALRARAEALGTLFFKHRWNPPRWPYIEPLKDAQADSMRLEKRLTSPRRLQAEHGNEWEQLADEIIADNSYIVRKAKTEAVSINKAFPEDKDQVGWRDLLNLDAKAATAPPAAAPDEKEEKNEEEEEGDTPATPARRINGVHA